MSSGNEKNDLWMIVAVIQPFKLDDVTLALEALPHFGGMTVTECRGFGQGKVAEESDVAAYASRGEGAQLIDFTTKTRVEIAAAGSDAAVSIADTIARAAHTGNPGDGKVFVWPLARAVRVRTFDEAESAL